MDKFFLDRYNGVTEFIHIDPNTEDFVIETVQDIEPVVDLTKTMRDHTFGHSMKSDVRLLAEIPLVEVVKWMNEGVNVFKKDDERKVRQKINENPHFKAYAKRVDPRIIISGDR